MIDYAKHPKHKQALTTNEKLWIILESVAWILVTPIFFAATIMLMYYIKY